MAGPRLGTILRHVRHLALAPGARAQSDAELLHDFAQRRDEAAFAALMQRHSGLVWGVCQHVLGQEQDAEDAFQATFLILSRQAATIHKAEALASWLHGTAFRVAMKVKRDAGRRRNHERQARPAAEAAPPGEGAWRELQAVLDEEVQRLSPRQRAAFVLCVLEGKSMVEAGQLLGWKPGTVSGTLARARQRLRTCLARRGIALSALLTGLYLAPARGQAAPALTWTTLCLVLGDAAPGAVPPRITTLAHEVMTTMSLKKTNVLTALFLALVLAAGSGTLALWAGGGGEPKAEPTQERESAPKSAADLQGDPLPPGAVGRLGTLRFRHTWDVGAFALSPDGKRLASAGDGAAVIWDTADGRELCRFEGHRRTVQALAFTPDGKSVASGAEDNVIRLWDAASGKERQTFNGHDGITLDVAKAEGVFRGVHGLAFTPDGQTLVSRGVDLTVRVWDVATGKELRRIDGLSGAAQALTLSPDGKVLAAVTGDFSKGPSAVRLYEVSTGKELRRLPQEGVMTSVAFSPDGKVLAAGWGANGDLSGEPGGGVKVWEVATGQPLASLGGHKRLVISVAFSPDGKTLLSGGMDCVTHLWDLATFKDLGQVGEGRVPVQAAGFSPDGKLLVMRTGYVGDHALRFWDVAGAKEVRRLGGHRGNVTALAFARDGRTLVSGSADRSVALWDLAGRKELGRMTYDDGDVTAVALSADGRVVRSGGLWGNVRVWDVTAGKQALEFQASDGFSPRMAFSPDGKVLASVPRQGQVGHLRDCATGQELRQLKEMPQWVNALAFSPDGRLLAVGAGQGPHFITLWDVATGQRLREFGEQGWVLALAFSPDGRTLASGHDDNKVRLWEVATGGERFAFDHGDRPAALAFSPDGTLLASACNETRSNGATAGFTAPPAEEAKSTAAEQARVRVWDPLTGARRATLAGHRGAVVSLVFSPDARLLASGSNDTTILLWDMARLPHAEQSRDAALTAKEAEARWLDLDNGDAGKAHQAIRELMASPRVATEMLKEHLRPVVGADPRLTARLIGELDSDDFDTRERAVRELEKLGEGGEGALRKALKDGPTLETRRRIETLLTALEGRQTRGVLRGLEVLERLGTDDARRLLDTLARGEPEMRLTREAKAAIERLAGPASKR
jgi:RNA polymerase sigma factor (sigma-70 family)